MATAGVHLHGARLCLKHISHINLFNPSKALWSNVCIFLIVAVGKLRRANVEIFPQLHSEQWTLVTAPEAVLNPTHKVIK